MAIVDTQRRMTEIGRIRLGERQGNRPVKLDRMRFTSQRKRLIEQVAERYGGVVEKWEEEQWQVKIEADEVPILLPMMNGIFSEWYELWSKGGVQRRCDGEYDEHNDKPCTCIAGMRDCKPTSRLQVWLPEIQTFGVWMIASTGYNANAELKGSVEMLQSAAAGLGRPVKAVLRIEPRKKTTMGATHRFNVPVLEARESVEQVLESIAITQNNSPVALPERPEPPAIEAPPDIQMPEERKKTFVATEAPITESQRKSLMAGFSSIGLDDEQRHKIIDKATSGRTQSSKEILLTEIGDVWAELTNRTKLATSFYLTKLWSDPAVGWDIVRKDTSIPNEMPTEHWKFEQWKQAYKYVFDQFKNLENSKK